MALEIKAPNQPTDVQSDQAQFSIFLAGSIEQDTASQWQTQVVKKFAAYPNVILWNPRRDEWNPNWKNVASNKPFRQQVTWELVHLERSDIVLMYFDPKTKSPISLLELGLFAHSAVNQTRYDNDGQTASKLQVICPDGFWRKGNVDITCERYGIDTHETMNDAINSIKKRWRRQIKTAAQLKTKKV